MVQIARDLGYKVEERDIARAELYLADEVFLTGTAAELVPVREVDDHPLGEPGEITRVIQAKFEDALHGRAEEYLEWLDFVEVPAGVDAPSKVELLMHVSDRVNRANYRSRLAAGAALPCARAPVASPPIFSTRKASDGTGEALRHDLARRHAGRGDVALGRARRCAWSSPSTRSACR